MPLEILFKISKFLKFGKNNFVVDNITNFSLTCKFIYDVLESYMYCKCRKKYPERFLERIVKFNNIQKLNTYLLIYNYRYLHIHSMCKYILNGKVVNVKMDKYIITYENIRIEIRENSRYFYKTEYIGGSTKQQIFDSLKIGKELNFKNIFSYIEIVN